MILLLLENWKRRWGTLFIRAELLVRALTHSSMAHERGATEPEREDNETLEFLGDAVVGMIAAEYVFRNYSRSGGRET